MKYPHVESSTAVDAPEKMRKRAREIERDGGIAWTVPHPHYYPGAQVHFFTGEDLAKRREETT